MSIAQKRAAYHCTQRIHICYGIVLAVGKHVIAQNTLAGGCVGVCIEESAQFWGVISGLQVIETGLSVVYIATTPNEANNLLLVVFV